MTKNRMYNAKNEISIKIKSRMQSRLQMYTIIEIFIITDFS